MLITANYRIRRRQLRWRRCK